MYHQVVDQSPTILIIEDDISLAKMYTAKFQMDGYNVIHAKDGIEGLNIVLGKKVHFILLDMMLPKMNGEAFLHRLKSIPESKDIPIIVLSNLTVKEEADKAYKLGVKEYLAKAMFTPEEIVEKVKKYLV